MWVPACLVHIVAGLALLAAWLQDSERRALRREGRDREVPRPTEAEASVP
jgi:hypothetical protein